MESLIEIKYRPHLDCCPFLTSHGQGGWAGGRVDKGIWQGGAGYKLTLPAQNDRLTAVNYIDHCDT